MSTVGIRDAGWQAIMEDERLAGARRKLSFHEIRLIVNHARITPSEAVERMRFLQGWVQRRRTEYAANNGDVEVGEWLDDLEEVLSRLPTSADVGVAKPVGGDRCPNCGGQAYARGVPCSFECSRAMKEDDRGEGMVDE